MWVLTVRSPSSALMDYEVKPGKNTIGRKPGNDVLIADESASRVHAEIYCQDGLAVITDLNSTNGTYINRVRLTTPHVFVDGDQIRIGECIITVSRHEEGLEPHLVQALAGTRPLTRDLILESIDQNGVFLDSISSRLTMILDLDTALQEITDMTGKALGAELAGIVLADHFDQLASMGIPAAIARQAIDRQSVEIVPDPTAAEVRNKQTEEKTQVSAGVFVPIKVDQNVVALLYACKTDPQAKPFTQHDVRLAVAISHQAALTIQREKLLQESRKLETLATMDSLTGLLNRRKIFSLAEEEFLRAQRFARPLTVLILDLDDLKGLNDEHGHLAGDQALLCVAQVCRNIVRSNDAVGRIGGDEFLILLVEASLEEAQLVADRLCQGITDCPVKSGENEVNISISIGMACSSDGVVSFTELFSQADERLIKTKKKGRNKTGISH